MRIFRNAAALIFALVAFALIAGCGGSSNGTDGTERPAPPKADVPSAKGKTLGDVLNNCYPPPRQNRACAPATSANIVIAPASQVFYKGENRYSFGVFHTDRSQISDADVALYFARVPGSGASTIPKGAGAAAGKSGSASPPPEKTGKQALTNALDQPAKGPFPAAVASLETKPAFRAETTTSDPDAATTIYTTNVNFPQNGEWRIAAVIRDGDKLSASLLPSAVVGEYSGIPRVGDRPPRIHTPTPEDVGGDLTKLTTRVPPESENQVDFYDALGKDPIVLLFSTPQFCQSRVCGPVLDIAEQVREQAPDDVKFIHMEIYKDNDPGKGVRPQVRAFNLPSEPWLFVIDRNGIVRTALEGAFSVGELEKAVKEVSG